MAVLGAGAVGCYYGGMLARAGAPVMLIGRARHVEAIVERGLVIEWAERKETVPVDASTQLEAIRGAELVLLCVKSQDTEAAARAVAPLIAAETAIVSLQNGVDNGSVVRSVLPANPVFAAVVYVGTYMNGPGIVRHAGRGDLVLGAVRGNAMRANDEQLAAIASTFERAGVPCTVTTDIDAALWTKLVINCAFNAVSALGRSHYGRMAAEPAVRGVMERALREAVAVGVASGVALDETALLPEMWRIADAMAGQHSSTAQDIAAGKRTEIDALNGVIARRGEAHGIDVPVNRTLHALVKLREAANETPSDSSGESPPGRR